MSLALCVMKRVGEFLALAVGAKKNTSLGPYSTPLKKIKINKN